MNVPVEVSIGEFFDKMTILEIKRSRIKDAAKRKNIDRELNWLNHLLEALPFRAGRRSWLFEFWLS